MSDQVLIDMMVTRGATRGEAEGLLKKIDARRRRELLAARVIPADLESAEARYDWCEANGGHLDSGSMFYFTCSTCGWTEQM